MKIDTVGFNNFEAISGCAHGTGIFVQRVWCYMNRYDFEISLVQLIVIIDSFLNKPTINACVHMETPP